MIIEGSASTTIHPNEEYNQYIDGKIKTQG